MHSPTPLKHPTPGQNIRQAYWRIARTALLLSLLVGSLAGCQNIPVVHRVQQAFDFAIYGQPDVPLSRASVDNLPYASMRAKMGRSGKVLMILGRYDGNDLHWISADHAVVATRHGRVIKTVGLKYDLKSTRFPDDDPIATGAHTLTTPVTVTRLVDFDTERRYGVPVVSTLSPHGAERIGILEREYDTFVIRETVEVEQLSWSFENMFWVDARSGYVWKSIQYFSPDLPPLELESLKPAGQ